MSSCGNRSRSARTTVRPPIPESNTPIGRSDRSLACIFGEGIDIRFERIPNGRPLILRVRLRRVAAFNHHLLRGSTSVQRAVVGEYPLINSLSQELPVNRGGDSNTVHRIRQKTS